ncbi:branched-chain amino acid aminotransferase [hydrocarbon metagenome]|uniref:Branched-chain amino acid aminotransferase n=1 Tax=hydrocarbon metagenome TaxID=938273 RepID=A0A0W8E8A1_9ZZZZ
MEICTGNHFLMDDQILPASCFQYYLKENTPGIYEVIRIIDSVPLFSEKHINRLMNSATRSDITLAFSGDYIMKGIYDLVKINGILNGNVKVLLHYIGDKANPDLHWYIYFIPHHYPAEEAYSEGVAVILFWAERANPNVKAANSDMRITIDNELKERRAYEALLVDSHGNITEGSRSNVFFVKNQTLFTASQDTILPGITRDAILEICKKSHYQVIEERVPHENVHLMDAVFITGTSPKVLPVQRIDNFIFESARNPVVLNIIRAYNKLINNYIQTNKL